jgi:hypothetical protein
MDKERNEEITNELIAIIWPLLDAGVSKDEIQSIIHNVLDSWTPPKP